MRTHIVDIEYYLPERIETNEELGRINPAWNVEQIVEKTGVYRRRLAPAAETSLDLGLRAATGLCSRLPELHRKIDGLIFCTVTEDHFYPKNAHLLHKLLDLPESVFCLDVGMACSGFVYSLAVAHGLIHTGVAGNVLIVTADTYSKCVGELDRSTRWLFSDGAAAVWVSGGDDSAGLIDLDCGAYGKGYDAAWIPAGMFRMPGSSQTKVGQADGDGNIRTMEEFHMDGKRMLALVGSIIPRRIKALLHKNGLSPADIDLFVFHQASKLVLDSLERLLRIPPEKNFRNLQDHGNLTSSSIPVALKDAIAQGRLAKGDKIVISGFGVGFSWSSAILAI